MGTYRTLEGIAKDSRVIKRNRIAILAAAALFYILAQGGLSEAEFVGIKIDEFSFAKLAIPVVMIGLTLQSVASLGSFMINLDIYDSMIDTWFPNWGESMIHRSFLDSPLFLIDVSKYQLYRGTKISTIGRDIGGIFELVLSGVLPLLFSVYAYWNLYTDEAVSTASASISLILFVIIGAACVFSLSIVNDH